MSKDSIRWFDSYYSYEDNDKSKDLKKRAEKGEISVSSLIYSTTIKKIKTLFEVMPSYKQSFFQALCQIDDEAERQERQIV